MLMADNQHNQDNPHTANSYAQRREERGFLHHVILFYAVGLMFLLVCSVIWFASDVLLLIFACVLLAVLLYHAAGRVQKWLPMSRGLALTLVVVLSLCVLGVAGWLMAPQISQQTQDLTAAIPKAVAHFRAALEGHEFLRSILKQLPSTDQLTKNIGLVFSGVFGAIGSFAIILFVGVYLAAQPRIYIDGIVVLVPHRKRRRIREVLDEIGLILGQWLIGKFISMVIVGIATAVGLGLLDVPLALVLGILAGLLDFIPYLGPIMAGGPAVLIAFAESPTLGLYVILLFVAIQIAEGYLLLPLIERKTVSLPPALTILMQVLLGALFGLTGVALATPLTAVLAVLIAMLYVQDVLGDAVKTPAEH